VRIELHNNKLPIPLPQRSKRLPRHLQPHLPSLRHWLHPRLRLTERHHRQHESTSRREHYRRQHK